MRSNQRLALLFCGCVLAATAAFGQIERDPTINPCQTLVQGIDRHLNAIDNGLERLVSLARLGTEQDRVRIAQVREQLLARRDVLVGRYELTLQNVDISCEECLARACPTIRPTLVEIRDRIAVVIQDILRIEMEVRARIATATRAAHAIRVTDQALFRAAQLARRTDNGVEAFPGLRRAFELQEQAKQALASGRFDAAMKITLSARDLVGRTIKAALDSVDIAAVRERAIDFWQQTNRMITRIESEINPGRNPKAARLLEMAKQESAKARELAPEQPYRALRHALAARRIVTEMLAFHRRAKSCEERGQHLAERIENAREVVAEFNNDKATQLLETAAGHHEKGVALCGEGKAAEATVQFDIAVKLAAKAVDLAKGTTAKAQALQAEIRKTGMIVKRAAEAAQSDPQKEQIAAAYRLIEEAKARIDNAQACLKLLDRATDIAFGIISQAIRPETNEVDQ